MQTDKPHTLATPLAAARAVPAPAPVTTRPSGGLLQQLLSTLAWNG